MRVHRPGSGRMVEEVIVNKNVSWLDSPAVWVCYLCGRCRRVSGQGAAATADWRDLPAPEARKTVCPALLEHD